MSERSTAAPGGAGGSKETSFWLLRALAHLPESPWARAAIVGVAFAAAHVAILAITRMLGESWDPFDVNLGFILAVQGGYAVAGVPCVLAAVRREALALSPLLPGGARDAERCIRQVGSPAPGLVRALAAAGIVLALVLQEVSVGRLTSLATGAGGIGEVWVLLMAAAFWVLLPAAGIVVARAAITFQRLGRQVRVNLLDPDSLRPFERVSLSLGVWTVGLFMLWFAVVTLSLSAGDFRPTAGVLAIGATIATVYLAVATTVLLVPAWGVHRTLQREKQEALGHLRPRLPDHRAAEAADTAGIEKLLLYDRIGAAPEWPFSNTTVLRFVVYLVLPAASMVAAALVERAVDQLVG